MRGPKLMLSSTESHSNRAPCWKTMPRSGPGPVIGTPSRRATPAVGARKPARMSSSVVLPQPDGPRTVRTSPGARVKPTPRNAWTSVPPGISKVIGTPSTPSSFIDVPPAGAAPGAYSFARS